MLTLRVTYVWYLDWGDFYCFILFPIYPTLAICPPPFALGLHSLILIVFDRKWKGLLRSNEERTLLPPWRKSVGF